jgi:lysozyme family protein
MKGVTQAEYTNWRQKQGLPYQDVQQISAPELTTIYKNDFWLPAACDRVRPKLDLVEFDTCANMGRNRAIKILQQAVGAASDGSFGPATQQACDNCNATDAVTQYCSIREALYRRFAQAPGQAIFLKGWLNRLNDLRVEAGVSQQRGPRGPADFGDAPYIAPIPDLAPDEPLEDWR